MKLFIVLSVIACGYAAKLDRTYLPPASAATAGGSPGSLTAPFGSPTGSGSSQGQAPSFSSSGPSSFTQLAQSSSGSRQGLGQAPSVGSSGPGRFPQPSQSFSGSSQNLGQAPSFGSSGTNRFPLPTQSNGPSGPSNLGQSFGQDNQSARPSNQYGPSGIASGATGRGSSATDFGAPGFGQSQDGAQLQPERAQASADRNAEILRYENENDGNTFAYSFETSNGISAEESGVATNGVQAQGGYSYTADDGEVFKVTYTADENGYQPQGDHLPTSPPIPDEILRSIEENARAAAAGNQEGAYQPDEIDSGSPQQYTGSSPSYNQGQLSAQSYNQRQSSAQSYNQPQGSAQGPSQQYGAPNTGSSGSLNQAKSGPGNKFSGSSSSFNQDSSAPSGQQGNSQFGAASNSQFGAASNSRFGTAFGRGSAQGSRFESQNNAATAGPSSSFSSAQNLQGNDNGYQYNQPQGPAGPFSAFRQDQSSAQNRPSQQYSTSAASGRGSTRQPSQQYGAPTGNGGSNQVSQQYGASIPSGRGSSQGQVSQYNAPASNTVRESTQGPSQQYGAPSTSGRGSSQAPQQYNAPSTPSRESNSPSQQYGAPNANRGINQGSQLGSPNSATPLGNTRFTGSFSGSRQDQSSAQNRPQAAFRQVQAQNDNGYQYDRPQGTPFGQGPSSQSGQNQQSPASQFNQPAQLTFPRPGSTFNQGPTSSQGSPSGLNFGAGPTTGPAAALVSQSLLPGPRGNGATASGSRPTQSSFGSSPGQYRPGQPAMAGANSYNQSGSGAPGRQGSQPNQTPFSPATPTFGGPRQPPSFSPESGYVY